MISYHLQDIGRYLVTVGYNCYHENNHVLMSKRRPGEIVIEKQQGMEVLGVDLSPSMSIKDHTVVGTLDKIERMPIT